MKILRDGQPVYICISPIGPTPGVECTEGYCPAGYQDKELPTGKVDLMPLWFYILFIVSVIIIFLFGDCVFNP
jgi:hypothetical protein